MCGVFDKHYYTPIFTAIVHYEEWKDSQVKVIYEILTYLTTVSTNYNKCIEAINYQYHGSPIIAYDIKSGKGVIIQVSSTILRPCTINLIAYLL